MQEIEANKKAWRLLSKDHYETFGQRLREKRTLLSGIIQRELGDVAGKTLIHLQCNTGADTLSLARMGASVTGVDLVADNIRYARQLAQDLGISGTTFIVSDLMEFMESHDRKYDIVFTSEGVIGWLPDLTKWGTTVRHLLKDDGIFYVMDLHPFYLMFDEDKLTKKELSIKYPYFVKKPDKDDTIGGYAAERREGENYYWMYTVSEVINALLAAGLTLEFFNEFDTSFFDIGGMQELSQSCFCYPDFRDKMPFSFSLKATVRKE